LGAEHDRKRLLYDTNGTFTSADASLPYAFGHYESSVYKSLMSYPWGYQPTWTLHISNPNVSFNGLITGAPYTENNAMAMQHWAPYVADFRQRLGEPSCDGLDPVLSDRTFSLGEHVTCTGENSLNAINVIVESGARLELIAPVIILNPETNIEPGSELLMTTE